MQYVVYRYRRISPKTSSPILRAKARRPCSSKDGTTCRGCPKISRSLESVRGPSAGRCKIWRFDGPGIVLFFWCLGWCLQGGLPVGRLRYTLTIMNVQWKLVFQARWLPGSMLIYRRDLRDLRELISKLGWYLERVFGMGRFLIVDIAVLTIYESTFQEVS